MAGIIEHGPVALGVAAEAFGAGAGGGLAGVNERSAYERGIQQIKANRMKLEAAQMELDGEREQMALRDQAEGLLANYGPGALEAAQFQDTGETGVPGVKRAPMQMPQDLWELYVQGDAETKERIKGDFDFAVAQASHAAVTQHVSEQGMAILAGEGVYGSVEEGAEPPPELLAAQQEVQQILEEVDKGILDPFAANERLNEIDQELFQARQTGMAKAGVHAAFRQKITGALTADDLGQTNTDLAQYYSGWQHAYQKGEITENQALAILNLSPDQLEEIGNLFMGTVGARMPQGSVMQRGQANLDGLSIGLPGGEQQAQPGAQMPPGPDVPAPESPDEEVSVLQQPPPKGWKPPRWITPGTKGDFAKKHVGAVRGAVDALAQGNHASLTNSMNLILGDDPDEREVAMLSEVLRRSKDYLIEQVGTLDDYKPLGDAMTPKVKEIMRGVWDEQKELILGSRKKAAPGPGPASREGVEGGAAEIDPESTATSVSKKKKAKKKKKKTWEEVKKRGEEGRAAQRRTPPKKD